MSSISTSRNQSNTIQVYRYAVQGEIDRLRRVHKLVKLDGIYGIPDSPLRWGVDFTWTLIKYIYTESNGSNIKVIQFSLDTEDPLAQVGEASIHGRRRVPLKDFCAGTFCKPEVIYLREIPETNITIQEMPPEFRNYHFILNDKLRRELIKGMNLTDLCRILS